MSTQSVAPAMQTSNLAIQQKPDSKDKDKNKLDVQNPASVPDFTADLQSLLDNDLEEESIYDSVR